MISWLCTVWKIHPPPINFISLSLAAGAQQPRTHSLWAKERRIRSSPCTQLRTENSFFICWWSETISPAVYDLTLFCHFLSIRVGRADGAIDSTRLIVWKTPAGTKRKRQEHCIIFSITEEHSELLNHAEVHEIGLTSRRALPESFKWDYQQGNCSFPACLTDTFQIKIFQWTWYWKLKFNV